MNFEERVIINEFHLNDMDDQVIEYIRHNKNQTVDNQMIVDSHFLYHRGVRTNSCVETRASRCSNWYGDICSLPIISVGYIQVNIFCIDQY